ncbi:hypothetical protein LXL04_022533 [Taraxacum kok-saghyz]
METQLEGKFTWWRKNGRKWLFSGFPWQPRERSSENTPIGLTAEDIETESSYDINSSNNRNRGGGLPRKKKMAAEEGSNPGGCSCFAGGNKPTAKELGRSSHEEEREAGSLLAGEGRCAVIGRKGESFHGA